MPEKGEGPSELGQGPAFLIEARQAGVRDDPCLQPLPLPEARLEHAAWQP